MAKGPLSCDNGWGGIGGFGLISTYEIQSTDVRDRRVALRLCLATREHGEVDLERHVSTFMAYARVMSIDLSRQWHCESEGRWLSACTCIESPGRTAMLLLPAGGGANGADGVALRQLVAHAIEQESSRDIRLLQALIEEDDSENRRVLEDAAFWEVAVLRYLELKLNRGLRHPAPRVPDGLDGGELEWIHYGPETHSAFGELIRATYEDGLDCPGLSNLREMEDVIAGHKASGRFDPRRWHLLRSGGGPVGCLLMGAHALLPIQELVYMGVHPSYRGRGVGRYMLDYCLYMAHREPCQSVTLAVDSNNLPARLLYEKAGFRLTHRRRAMIRPLHLSPEIT